MRIILIDPDDDDRQVLAVRLRAQGYVVEPFSDAAAGANAALASPPVAIVADLWMKGISGIQLCRLIRAEPATVNVPVVLRATHDTPRNRFWAHRAGAAGYVAKGRMGELVRALSRCVRQHPVDEDSFFFQLSGGAVDIRDRISEHLDAALFESVLASEIRALGAVGTFERLWDLFSQLLVQITSYRWVGIATNDPPRVGVHCRPAVAQRATAEALAALRVDASIELVRVEDDDADDDSEPSPPLTAAVRFGGVLYGHLALGPSKASEADQALVDLLARELGGPLRMVALVEETRRLASIDHLTSLPRRGAFVEAMGARLAGAAVVHLAILDLDHFKHINDGFGHAVGDRVLVAVAQVVREFCTNHGATSARWGGEEFVVALEGDDPMAAVDGLREAIAALDLVEAGRRLPVTTSIGCATCVAGERLESLVDRADRALYAAKREGRNRVVAAEALAAAA